jgi:DNA-binding MarR family transcriptional regulator
MATPYYQDVLRIELARRIERNGRYSLRAFARALAVPASTLSRALNGHRTISLDVASRIVDGLMLAPRERRLFLDSLAPSKKPAAAAVVDLEEDTFRAVSDWYHYAIMEMTFLKRFDPDPRWIAARLGLEPLTVQLALDRLRKLGLVERVGAKLKKTQRTLWARAKDGTTTAALRAFQRQCLALAEQALENVPIERRTATTVMLPVDPAKLPLARGLIEDFAVELCRTMATGNMTDVYQLTIHFHTLLREEPKG